MTAEDIDRAVAELHGGSANVNEGGRGEIMAANREGYMLRLGALVFEVLPCGRVLVSLPPQLLPFGCAMRATVLYPSLGAFIAAVRRMR